MDYPLPPVNEDGEGDEFSCSKLDIDKSITSACEEDIFPLLFPFVEGKNVSASFDTENSVIVTTQSALGPVPAAGAIGKNCLEPEDGASDSIATFIEGVSPPALNVAPDSHGVCLPLTLFMSSRFDLSEENLIVARLGDLLLPVSINEVNETNMQVGLHLSNH